MAVRGLEELQHARQWRLVLAGRGETIGRRHRQVGVERGWSLGQDLRQLVHELVLREPQQRRLAHLLAQRHPIESRVQRLRPQRRRADPLNGVRAHQMFPAPGVYEADTTELVMTVSALTTPLNVEMPALTVRLATEIVAVDAFTVTSADAVTVIPLESRVTWFPLASWMVMEAGAVL